MSECLYVQSITGYNGQTTYAYRAKKLRAAGFIRLRSSRHKDRKYWEIWYLPYLLAARGPVKGLKLPDIVSWLMREVQPGEIQEGGAHHGLSVD